LTDTKRDFSRVEESVVKVDFNPESVLVRPAYDCECDIYDYDSPKADHVTVSQRLRLVENELLKGNVMG